MKSCRKLIRTLACASIFVQGWMTVQKGLPESALNRKVVLLRNGNVLMTFSNAVAASKQFISNCAFDKLFELVKRRSM